MFGVFLLVAQAFAAPVPGTSTSLLTNEKPGLFRSSKGFSVHAAQTDWELAEPPKTLPHIVTLFRAPQQSGGVQPVLTVRVDQLQKKIQLREYVQQWMKDYSILGFNVLKAGQLKVKSYPAFLIDVIETTGTKRLRQIVYLKDQTAVILTCRDKRDSFEKTVRACNEIFKSFEWTASPVPSLKKGV